MLLATALMSVALGQASSPSAVSAVDAFMRVCAASPTMQKMEANAQAQGWTKEVYPTDIRAGFLAELIKQSSGSASVNYAEIYSGQVAEGDAYLIISRDERLFGSKLPTTHSCRLSVFGYQGEAPTAAVASALGSRPVEPWSDEQGNEVLNWYSLKRINARSVQLSKVITKTRLAGPADLSGLALSIEFSESK
jgi:hypothetical protein